MENQSVTVVSNNELITLLDELLEPRQGKWWDTFFTDRDKPCPFFVDWPDENLCSWVSDKKIKPGKTIELGCGHGRNALYLAKRGFDVYAIDFSQTAIDWARERLQTLPTSNALPINFQCRSVFDLSDIKTKYDFVYDCGCFHHLAPHRRQSYLDVVDRSLSDDGMFGLVCFAPEGGSGMTDLQVYEQRKLGGGLGYTEDQLRKIFGQTFHFQEFRPMKEMDSDTELFGKSFCWVALMRKK